MAILLIPTDTDANFEQITELDGQDYILRFTFNEREGVYYLDLFDEDRVAIKSGIKLVQNINLIRTARHLAACPQGELFLADLGTDDSPASTTTLSLKAQLYYQEPV